MTIAAPNVPSTSRPPKRSDEGGRIVTVEVGVKPKRLKNAAAGSDSIPATPKVHPT
jgi:hypothetical protein